MKNKAPAFLDEMLFCITYVGYRKKSFSARDLIPLLQLHQKEIKRTRSLVRKLSFESINQ